MVRLKLDKKLEAYIRKNPGMRAKVIAKDLNLDKTVINKFLHDSVNFTQDKNWGWHVLDNQTDVLTLASGWVTALSFEKSLKKCGCLVSSSAPNIKVIFPKGCYIMLDAGIRLLFLLNYLKLQSKNIELDFSEAQQTQHYLLRAGFFDALNNEISVNPPLPQQSTAKYFRGQADSLVELAPIDINKYDESIPDELTTKFVTITDKSYEGAAYNAFSELCDNVIEHSKSCLGGLAGLQQYNGRKPHVQIVISDAGKGIINTLRPALEKNTGLNFDINKLTDTELLIKTITETGLSSKNIKPGDDIGGLGMFRGGLGLKKHGAVFSIRQENMHIRLKLKNKQIQVDSEKLNAPILPGTHICLDFFID